MFINISNHPSTLWTDEQLNMAKQFGEIVDFPFPKIPASEDEEFIHQLVEKYVDEIMVKFNAKTDILHIMGEMCFSFSLIRKLSANGFTCIASTSERTVQDRGNGHKDVLFKFVRFRKYSI